MVDPFPLNFAHQDLRNRSFRHQHLEGAIFHNADLRGCDFTGARLVGANLIGAKLGQSRRQWLGLMMVGMVTALVVFEALSKLLFGAWGQTPGDRSWAYFILFLVLSGLSGGTIALAPVQTNQLQTNQLLTNQSRLSQLLTMVSAATSGAMTGFFYAGIWSNYNPYAAGTGALLMAGIMAIASSRLQRAALKVVIAIAGALAAYGFMLLIGMVALSALTTHHKLLGLICSGLAILYAQCTLSALSMAHHIISQVPGTCFHQANIQQILWDPIDEQPENMHS